MIFFLLIYGLLLAVVLGVLFFRTREKRLLLVMAAVFVLGPVVVFGSIAALRTPIQQGKIFPELGPLLLLAAPPDDLWVPLAEAPLEAGRKEYVFDVSHKYVGNHQVHIEFAKTTSMEEIETDLKFTLILERDGQVISSKTSGKRSSFWGQEKTGCVFIWYQVPEHAPAHVPLKARIVIDGEAESFLARYPGAKLVLRKGSDL